MAGYLDEDGVAAGSSTETYAAVRLDVDTRRWAGVPFYLRTGKRLGKRVTEIAVMFKKAPHLPFKSTATEELGQNAIVIRVQPDEGVTLRFGSKVPGAQMEVRDVTMDFGYGRAFTESSPEAYERLILDVLLGEPPLFPRHEEVELSWQILDPIEAFWDQEGPSARAVHLGRLGTRQRRRDDAPRRTRVEAAVIVDLPSTTTAHIAKKLVRLRADTGSMALSRVLTLLVVVDEDDADAAIDTANAASRQHPCRIIVVVAGNKRGAARLDAQIRLGGDAGASEVVVLRLYGKLAEPRPGRGDPAAARRLPHRRVVAHARTGRSRRPTRSARWPSAGSPMPRSPSQAPRTALRRALRGLRGRRHRPGVVADHLVARPAGRRPRPAALRVGHQGHRRRRDRLPLG